MNCYVSGIIGLAMLGGSAATMTVTEEQHNKLRNLFSDELDKIHEKIVIERRNHYLQGLALGLLFSYLLMSNLSIDNRFHKISLFFAITLITGVVYYMLRPKSDYMLRHLKTQEENKAWLEVYNTMKSRYLTGLILGALAAIPIGNSFC